MTTTVTITTLSDIQKALAAMSSLAIIAAALPTTAVHAHLVDGREAARESGVPVRASLAVLEQITEACQRLGHLGDQLQATILAEQAQGSAR